jgi:tetratricopeptide (TPR) repeat protein
MPRTRAKPLALLLACCACAPAGAKEKPEVWLEVRSPHFLVATNGNEKQGRRVAGQIERIREAFHMTFPNQRVDPSAPIIVIAAKDEKSFEALVPRQWLAKGALQRAGLFQRGPEKNYILLRLDTMGENPYHSIYHEYTHLLTSQFPEPLPLWLDEGLAEFYGNSEIQQKEVLLGRIGEGELQLLREARLLPLKTLFAVDHSSPFYNEENKGSIFYAESWALVHMLTSESFGKQANPLKAYFDLIEKKTDPMTAARQAFGDLDELQKRLETYVSGGTFKYFALKGTTQVDEQTFTVREMSQAEVDALRGDFLVYNDNPEAARAMLQKALQEDPKNASACESMGLLELHEKNLGEAKNWFTKAMELDSKSYLAYYYSATMRMREMPGQAQSDEVGESLRKAIAINPDFAPALEALAQFYTMRGDHLEEAHKLALQAVQLDPHNLYYYLTTANVLLRMGQADNAIRACKKAMSLANSQGELAAAESALAGAQKYQEYLNSRKQTGEQSAGGSSSGDGQFSPPVLRHRGEESAQTPQAGGVQNEASGIQFHSDAVQRGAREDLAGTIEDVQCAAPAVMKMTFKSGSQTVSLFSDNFYTVKYSALNFTPTGVLHPCQDIEGMKAKVFFYNLKGRPNEGELISVQLRK